MSIEQHYRELRKFIAEHEGVLGMLLTQPVYNRFCDVYLRSGSGGRRPSDDEMRSDRRYLIEIGAEL